MPITTAPNRADTRRLRWLKMLTAIQALAGANPAYDPTPQDPTRRLIFKLCEALGASVLNNEPQPRLLRKLLDRLNALSAVQKAVPPPFPFFSSGATARYQDGSSQTEEKMLAEFNRAQSFSVVGAPAINGSAPDNNDTALETERKILKRLNQIIA